MLYYCVAESPYFIRHNQTLPIEYKCLIYSKNINPVQFKSVKSAAGKIKKLHHHAFGNTSLNAQYAY